MTVDATAIEHEAKFEVDREYDPPDLRGVVGGTERLPEQRLRTVYFDTPDRRLAQRGLALRHRTVEGEGAPTWTLKLPGDQNDAVLHRAELSWPGERQTAPGEPLAILRGLVRRADLVEAGELRTVRRRLVLRDAGMTESWGELDDDLVTVVGGPNDGAHFRQLEVELAADSSARADRVLKRLRESGAIPTTRSKLSMAVGEPPAGAKQRRRGERLRDTVEMSIRSNLDRLLDHDYRLRLDPGRPEPRDIHQARVAVRRLRSDLKTFGPVLDPVWLEHSTEELRWIGTVLGRVRDADVLAGSLGEAAVRPGGAELLEKLRAERARAASDLHAVLESERYIDLLDRLHAAQEATPFLSGAAQPRPGRGLGPATKAAVALPVLVRGRWRSLRRKVRQGGPDPTDRELHQMRIRAKRLRYASETAAPVIGKPARRTASAAEAVQGLLGELHDAVTAETWLRELPRRGDISPAAAFTAGVLCTQQHTRQQQLRQEWQSRRKELQAKKNHSWLK